MAKSLSVSDPNKCIPNLQHIRDYEFKPIAKDILGVYFSCENFDAEPKYTSEQHFDWKACSQAFLPCVTMIEELYPELYKEFNSNKTRIIKKSRQNALSRICNTTLAKPLPGMDYNTRVIQATYDVSTDFLRYEQCVDNLRLKNDDKAMESHLQYRLIKDAKLLRSICASLVTLYNVPNSPDKWILGKSTLNGLSCIPENPFSIHSPIAQY